MVKKKTLRKCAVLKGFCGERVDWGEKLHGMKSCEPCMWTHFSSSLFNAWFNDALLWTFMALEIVWNHMKLFNQIQAPV